ncbi:MAG: hypothetical protein QOG54_575 [Actinomycetota bacterium]|nr:hypothetical protein [Actinomycetota bacterium]
MDDASVRQAAEAHAVATVSGDLKTAGSYLDKSAYSAAGEVMKSMPDPLEASQVTTVEAADEGFDVRIEYSGAGSTTTILSTWQAIDGAPKIVGLQVV